MVHWSLSSEGAPGTQTPAASALMCSAAWAGHCTQKQRSAILFLSMDFAVIGYAR